MDLLAGMTRMSAPTTAIAANQQQALAGVLGRMGANSSVPIPIPSIEARRNIPDYSMRAFTGIPHK
jgi:hypothetical protein